MFATPQPYEHISLDDGINTPSRTYNRPQAQDSNQGSYSGSYSAPVDSQEDVRELDAQENLVASSYERSVQHRAHSRDAIRRKVLYMVGAWLMGTLSAIAHHLYNFSRDGESATNTGLADQTWAIRFGTGFAFLAISLLSTAVTLAFYQLVWHTVQNHGFSVSGLDNLFAMNHDLSSLVSLEILKQATGVFIVGVFIWLLPLTAIPTPGTLSVGNRPTKNQTSSCVVPSLNFLEIASLSPTADHYTNLALLGVPGDPESGAEYNSFSPAASRVGSAVAFAGNILPFSSPCGANCSYSFQFTGPTWDCQNVNWNASDTPWYTKDYMERLFYNFDPAVYYNGTSALSNNSGELNGEFWAAWAYWNPADRHYASNGLPYTQAELGSQVPGSPYGPPANDTTFDLLAIRCTDYNATFSVDVSFVNSIQHLNITNIKLLNPANYTSPDLDVLGGLAGIAASNPNNNAFANYALRDLLTSILEGQIQISGSASTISYVSYGSITSTNLVEPWVVSSADSPGNYTNYFTVRDLQDGFEELHHNITLSILGNSEWIYTTNATTQCMTFGSHLVFVYEKHNREQLWACYAVAILTSGTIVILGVLAMYSSHEAWDISFSRILLTTRNPRLDQLFNDVDHTQGKSRGGQLRDVKLQFGNVWGDTSPGIGKGFYPSVRSGAIPSPTGRLGRNRTFGTRTASGLGSSMASMWRRNPPEPPGYAL